MFNLDVLLLTSFLDSVQYFVQSRADIMPIAQLVDDFDCLSQ